MKLNDSRKAITESLNTYTKLMRGVQNMMEIDELKIATTPKELVYTENPMSLYHYKPAVNKPHSVPVLVCYALVNKQYMLDLQEDRSVIKKLLGKGLDVYMIDWGYPGPVDKYITMDDYIDGYLNNAVDFVREAHGQESINIIGICQGATMSAIYASLHPEKVRSLVTMVMPFDFSTDDGYLFRWSRDMDIENMVKSYNGLLPGDTMNFGFNALKPFELSFDKYINFIDKLDNKDAVVDFLRMEQWIYDSPDQAGEMLIRFVNDMYKGNKFMKAELEINGRIADPKNITMPVLCMLGQKDHLVPPAATRPFVDAVGSSDKTLLEYPVGHIGMFVSSKAQKEVAPKIATWIREK